jgi:hypothetical protein
MSLFDNPVDMAAAPEIEIVEKAKAIFPSWVVILDDALKSLDNKLTKEYIRTNFCDAVLQVEKKAYETFSDYESKAFPELVVLWYEAHSARIDEQYEKGILSSLQTDKSLGDALKAVVRNVMHESYPTIQKFQISVSQMRKKRAGETFQEIILRLLQRIDVPCQKAKGVMEAELGHTDIVAPDLQTAIATPDKAIFIACQRTLAERWWSSTAISRGGRRGYIVTIDKRLSNDKARRLNTHNLVAYIRDDVKAHPDLSSMAWIRNLSDLPSDLKLT